jgi:hypothetical protein
LDKANAREQALLGETFCSETPVQNMPKRKPQLHVASVQLDDLRFLLSIGFNDLADDLFSKIMVMEKKK